MTYAILVTALRHRYEYRPDCGYRHLGENFSSCYVISLQFEWAHPGPWALGRTEGG